MNRKIHWGSWDIIYKLKKTKRPKAGHIHILGKNKALSTTLVKGKSRGFLSVLTSLFKPAQGNSGDTFRP